MYSLDLHPNILEANLRENHTIYGWLELGALDSNNNKVFPVSFPLAHLWLFPSNNIGEIQLHVKRIIKIII